MISTGTAILSAAIIIGTAHEIKKEIQKAKKRNCPVHKREQWVKNLEKLSNN